MFFNNGLLLLSIYDDIIFCNTTYKCINNLYILIKNDYFDQDVYVHQTI